MGSNSRNQKMTPQKTKAIDSGSRKLEAKEKAQDKRTGKTGQPVRSVGRHLRDGWISGA